MKRKILVFLFAAINWLLIIFSPLLFFTCKLLSIKKEKIEKFILKCNTKLLILKNIKVLASEILVLLPRCIQNNECINKVAIDIENCKQCGKCQIAKIINISRNFGVKLAVATGSGIAMKLVEKIRPKAIVAVACEKELLIGVSDTKPLPVMAIANIRPYGPCLNTGVDINQVRNAIEFFLETGKPR